MDEAQKTRFLNFPIEFSLDAWAEWAEEAGVDGRCINFVLSYSDELFKADEEGNRICNPRSFVLFANTISGIDDWDKAENLSFISTIANGCFKDEGGRFANMFAAFLRTKMHLLIQPKEILTGSWDTVKEKLESSLYDKDGSPRPDISSLLERRFTNYVNAWLGGENHSINVVKDRILKLIENPKNGGKELFPKDVFHHMLKEITSKRKNQTNKLLFEPKIAAILQ